MENLGKSIAFINDKGGVTKSTSSICYATYKQRQGHKVAVVDVDPRHTSLDWAAKANEAGIETPLMVGISHSNVGKEIDKLKKDYDYVIVDGMSSFVNSGRRDVIGSIISTVDVVLIPMQPNPFDMWALAELTDMVKGRQAYADGMPKAAIFGGQVRENTNDWKDFMAEREKAPFPILNAFIPLDVEFPRTTGRGETPFNLKEGHKAHVALLKWAESLEEFING